MNIFVLDSNPVYAAKYHCDSHVIKMILESAQMMCTVLNEQGFETPYKSTHKNHPCTIWLRESIDNWYWLYQLAEELNKQYKLRYQKFSNHKSFDVIRKLPTPNLPKIGLTPFAQAMPDEYRSEDAVKAYRKYYVDGKKHLLKYRTGVEPVWL